MKKQNEYVMGSLAVAFANSLVGVNIIINKLLLVHIPILILLSFRYLLGFAFLLLVPLFTKNKYKFFMTETRFTKRDFFIYFLMAVSGGAVFNFIYMAGIDKTTATATGIISSSVPTLIVLFSYLFLKEKIKPVHFLCVFLVLVGVLILNLSRHPIEVSGATYERAWLGNTIVFLAMIPEALFAIFAKMLKVKVSVSVSSLYINFINFVLCLPFFYIQVHYFSLARIEPAAWVLIAFLGLTSSLFYVFYNHGIAKINANTAALLTGVFPLSTAFLAIVFLNESLTLSTCLGMACVLGSIYIGVKYK